MNTKEILNNELNRATEKYKKILTHYKSEDKKLYELTEENVINVEIMLLFNPRYSNFNNTIISVKEFEINPKNYLINESSTSLIKLIKGGLENEKIFETTYKIDDNLDGNLIFHILRKLNQENSTRVSIKNIQNMTEVINQKCFVEKKGKHEIEQLFKILENIDKGHDLIGKLTVIDGNNENFSLSTKFCHYMSINYFEDSNKRDSYSIYDNIVAKSIPEYFSYFKQELIKKDIRYKNIDIFKFIDKETLKRNIRHISSVEKRQEKYVEFYKNFQKLIDDIIEIASKIHGKRISRNGFDHILWYMNK